MPEGIKSAFFAQVTGLKLKKSDIFYLYFCRTLYNETPYKDIYTKLACVCACMHASQAVEKRGWEQRDANYLCAGFNKKL